jgi:hypothetical protein
MSDSLQQLAGLLKQRAAIDHQIAKLIGYPAHPGHIGEFIAAAIFDIELNPSASQAAHDGHFRHGPLAGKSVNIKLYSRQSSLLDVADSDTPIDHPDYYLVMVGPKGTSLTSRGTSAPLSIDTVYLFDAHELLSLLKGYGVKIGVATSVRAKHWKDAEIFPEAINSLLVLTPEQREMLGLFTLVGITDVSAGSPGLETPG